MTEIETIEHRRGCAGGRVERFPATRPGRVRVRQWPGAIIDVTRKEPTPTIVARCLECGEQTTTPAADP